MQTIFFTDRLSLRPIAPEDHAFVLELVNTEGWLRFIGDRQVHHTEDAMRYIEKIRASPQILYWVVRTKEAQIPVGIVSFLKRETLPHFDLGFAFLPQHGGRGYAWEAASLVLNEMKKDPAHRTILATTLAGNSRSIALLEKLGFVFSETLENNGEALQVYRHSALLSR